MSFTARSLLPLFTFLAFLPPAHADFPVFSYTLEGSTTSLEARCSDAKLCFPIVVSLRENGTFVRSRAFSSISDPALKEVRDGNFDHLAMAYQTQISVDSSGHPTSADSPFVRDQELPDYPYDYIAGLVLAPAVRSGAVALDRVHEYSSDRFPDDHFPFPEELIRKSKERSQAFFSELGNGVSTRLSVFRKLVQAFWPKSDYTPATSLSFANVSGSIRIEGRGITDGNGHALYLACVENTGAPECHRFQFILERASGNERAYLGSPFTVKSSLGFKDILEERISQIVNGQDFREFFGKITGDSNWLKISGPLKYQGREALPTELSDQWHAFVSRDVRAWQLRPVSIAPEDFERIIDLLDIERALWGTPCNAQNRIRVGSSDGQIDWMPQALAQRIGIDAIRTIQYAKYSTNEVFHGAIRTLFQMLLESRACAPEAPAGLMLSYDIDPHGKNHRHTCIDWQLSSDTWLSPQERPRLEIDRHVLRDCSSDWTVTRLQTSVEKAIAASQGVFRRLK